MEQYEHLKAQSDDFKKDFSGKSILQQYLLVKDKYNLSLEEVVALTADFLIAGVDTVISFIHIEIRELYWKF